jgi:hypothetical protein
MIRQRYLLLKGKQALRLKAPFKGSTQGGRVGPSIRVETGHKTGEGLGVQKWFSRIAENYVLFQALALS